MIFGNDLEKPEKKWSQGNGQIKGNWAPSSNVDGAKGSKKILPGFGIVKEMAGKKSTFRLAIL